MKKKLLGVTALLLVLLLLCACGKQKEEPSAEEPPSAPFQNVYDDGGNLLIEYLTAEDGSYNGKREFSYEDGQMKKRVYDKNDTLIQETREEYDTQGNLIKEFVYDGIKNTKEETAYTYNSEGKWTRIASTYFFGGMGHKIVTEYNEMQQPVRYSDYSLNGVLRWQMDCEYEGNLRVKTTIVNRSLRERYYWISEYDKEGHCISETYYDNNDKATEVRTYIWENGHQIKSVSSKGNYTVYYYDEKGKSLGHHEYDVDGNLTGIYDADYRPIDTPFATAE